MRIITNLRNFFYRVKSYLFARKHTNATVNRPATVSSAPVSRPMARF